MIQLADTLPVKNDKGGPLFALLLNTNLCLVILCALPEIASLYATIVTARCAFTALPCTNTLYPCLLIAHGCVRAFV